MTSKRPTTIAEYIKAAPPEGQPHLRRLYAILKSAAPEAEEAIKWGNPFFVEPRFVFAFSAHKAHLSFAPTAAAMEHFRKQLEVHQTTKNFLKVPYDEPLPEARIREIAEYCVRELGKRKDDAFW
ncbi:iron chaperone [Lysobacter sp. A286]